jgi:hypothetical protein
MKRQPVSYDAEERDEEGKSDNAKNQQHDERYLPDRAGGWDLTAGYRSGDVSRLSLWGILGRRRCRSRRGIGHAAKLTASPIRTRGYPEHVPEERRPT